MARSISLFCIIYGVQDAAPFSIKVTEEDTVHDLKKLIKEECKPEMDNIASHNLKLWIWNQPGEVKDIAKCSIRWRWLAAFSGIILPQNTVFILSSRFLSPVSSQTRISFSRYAYLLTELSLLKLLPPVSETWILLLLRILC